MGTDPANIEQAPQDCFKAHAESVHQMDNVFRRDLSFHAEVFQCFSHAAGRKQKRRCESVRPHLEWLSPKAVMTNLALCGLAVDEEVRVLMSRRKAAPARQVVF